MTELTQLACGGIQTRAQVSSYVSSSGVRFQSPSCVFSENGKEAGGGDAVLILPCPSWEVLTQPH